MKLKVKKRIINKSNAKDKTGFIFFSNKINLDTKKELLLNNTKIYRKDDYFFQLYKVKDDKQFIYEKFSLNKNDILDIIDIYDKKIKIKLVNLKFDTKLENFENDYYFDILEKKEVIPDMIYKGIYSYNKNIDNYLSNIINSKNDDVTFKVIDLYYYLIGYI